MYEYHLADMKGKIRVYCRLRPLSEKELAEKERNVLASLDEFTVEHPWKDDIKQHMYDRVFDGYSTQQNVFEDTQVSFTKTMFTFVLATSHGKTSLSYN